MRKALFIVINGKGGSGKDTLVSHVIDTHTESSRRIYNLSAITPIKEIAKQYGYDEHNKSIKARKFLADLKMVFVNWNNLPIEYLKSEILKIADSNDEDTRLVFFIHIREADEIDKFIDAANKLNYVRRLGPAVTLLIRSDRTEGKEYGNSADDDVENYVYDYIFENNIDNETAKEDFRYFVENTIFKECDI